MISELQPAGFVEGREFAIIAKEKPLKMVADVELALVQASVTIARVMVDCRLKK